MTNKNSNEMAPFCRVTDLQLSIFHRQTTAQHTWLLMTQNHRWRPNYQ